MTDIKELLARATPRPWAISPSHDGRPYIKADGTTVAKTYRAAIDYGAIPGEANAALIVEAVNSIESLLQFVSNRAAGGDQEAVDLLAVLDKED